MRRAKNKFPGKQKVWVSNKYGFTKFTRPQFEKLQGQGKFVRDGLNVKLITEHGPLSRLAIFKEDRHHGH
jgi:large subunit ribosomal protein L10e